MEDAIEWAGSKSELARKLGVSKPAVSAWVKQKGLPAGRAIDLERLSGGRLKAVDLVAPGPVREEPENDA